MAGLGGLGRISIEKNLSAKQSFKEANPWLQASHENQGRPPDSQEKACQGQKTPDRLKISPSTLKFPRSVRIRSRADYLRIQRNGRGHRGRYLILLHNANNLPTSRFGITVSRKIGNAVARNRLKRKFREIQRLNRHRILPGNDIIMIARGPAGQAEFNEIETEFMKLALKSGILIEAEA